MQDEDPWAGALGGCPTPTDQDWERDPVLWMLTQEQVDRQGRIGQAPTGIDPWPQLKGNVRAQTGAKVWESQWKNNSKKTSQYPRNKRPYDDRWRG